MQGVLALALLISTVEPLRRMVILGLLVSVVASTMVEEQSIFTVAPSTLSATMELQKPLVTGVAVEM